MKLLLCLNLAALCFLGSMRARAAPDSASVPDPKDTSYLPGKPWQVLMSKDSKAAITVTFEDNHFTWEVAHLLPDHSGAKLEIVRGTYHIKGNKIYMVSTMQGKTTTQTYEWHIGEGKLGLSEVLTLEGDGKHYEFQRFNTKRF